LHTKAVFVSITESSDSDELPLLEKFPSKLGVELDGVISGDDEALRGMGLTTVWADIKGVEITCYGLVCTA
jgi:hypothetical protein